MKLEDLRNVNETIVKRDGKSEGILNKISSMNKEPRVEYSPINGKDAWQVYVWSPKVKKYIPQGSPHKSEKDAKKDAKGFSN